MTANERTAAEREDADTTAERLKERIYATITMIAVMVGLASDEHVGVLGAAATVAVTALGVWAATIVADLQAHRVVHLRHPSTERLRHVLFVSSPLLLSAAAPLALLLPAAIGVLTLHTALLVATGTEVGSLFFWGFAGDLRMGTGPLGALLTGIVDVAIGVAVAMVKYVAGH